MPKYPHIAVTKLGDPPTPVEINNKGYNDFYRIPIPKLEIAVWGFSEKKDLFTFLSKYPLLMTNFHVD